MSDEEDTANLLGNDRTVTEKEIKINPVQHAYQDPSKNTSSNIHHVLSALAILTSGVCFGYDLGIVGLLIKPISNTLNSDCVEQFYLIGTWLLAAIMSGIFGGIVIDICGRKWCTISSSLFLIFASILPCVTKPYLFLLCSRFLSGFNGPLLIISQAIYTSETSCPKYRGAKLTFLILGSSLGSFLTCIAGLYVDINNETWKIAIGMNAIPAAVTLIVTLIWLEESPHFKLYQHTKNINKRVSSNRVTILIEVFVISVFLILFQQLSGRYTVFYYAPRLFSLLGLYAPQATFVTVFTFSIVKLVCTFLCLCIIDRIGRRTSLIMSSTIMMTSLAFLALLASIDNSDISFSYLTRENCHRIILPDSISFLTAPDNDDIISGPDAPVALPNSPPPYPMLPTPLSLVSPELDLENDSPLVPSLRIVAVINLLLYEAAYALGFGTLTWVLLSELFPACVHGRAMCAIICLRWLADFIIPAVFIKIGSTLSMTFLIYSLICMLSILFTFFLVPETKGKTLHQVAQELRNISLSTRIFQNLYGLPYFNNIEWLEERSQQYRTQNRQPIKSTNI